MKKIFIVFHVLLLSLVGCDKTDSNGIPADLIPKMLGSWGDQFLIGNCQTTVSYSEDMTFSMRSGEASLSGLYVLEVVVSNPEAYLLEMHVLADNVEPNCADEVSDDRGYVYDPYISFPDYNTMYWIDREALPEARAIRETDAFATFTRIFDN